MVFFLALEQMQKLRSKLLFEAGQPLHPGLGWVLRRARCSSMALFAKHPCVSSRPRWLGSAKARKHLQVPPLLLKTPWRPCPLAGDSEEEPPRHLHSLGFKHEWGCNCLSSQFLPRILKSPRLPPLAFLDCQWGPKQGSEFFISSIAGHKIWVQYAVKLSIVLSGN